MKRVEYLEATSVEEASGFLADYGSDAKVVAGGTDLLVQLRNRKAQVRYLIDLKGIKGLDYVQSCEGEVRIGALTTVAEVARNTLIASTYSVLADAARVLGSRQIRNMATVGGNLCNAAPSAELASPLLVLNARVVLRSARGERVVPIEQFFVGPGQTILGPDEVLKEILLPPRSPGTRGLYLKLGLRKSMDIAIVGVAIWLQIDGAGVCRSIAIGLGAVSPTPIRAKKAEGLLQNQSLSEDLIAEAGRVASQECSPISDVRASAGYRKQMVEVLVRRGLKKCWDFGG